MRRGERQARKAIARRLEGEKQPILLYHLHVLADDAAREASGRLSDLFSSLWHYERLLPAGWDVDWLTTSDTPTATCMAYAIPPGWTPETCDSPPTSNTGTLLMVGSLRRPTPEQYRNIL